MPSIRFKTKLLKINTWTLVVLPKEASVQLPSRGLAMVKGTINNLPFQTTLEPDGNGSHWFKPDKSLLMGMNAHVGDLVSLAIEPTKEWSDPEIPKDIMDALKADAQARKTWGVVTPMARWEWIRWIRATNRMETRQKRIEVACSKLRSGMRRPCCFNSSMCTEPYVSKSGVLLEPAVRR
jgi:hypothetical protein